VERKFARLESGWLGELLRKRKSNFSCVLAVETDDPVRIDQVRAYFLHETQYADASFYLFDPWSGLRAYDRKESRFAPANGNGAYRPEGCSDAPAPVAPELGVCLRQMDRVLKERRTVLLLQWLDAGRQASSDPALAHALRAWTLDPDLLRNGSTVVVIASDTSALLDDATRKLVAWKRAPLANAAEREHFIRYSAECLDLPEKESYQQLVMISAGLGLHQLESSLLETYCLKKEFSPETLAALKSEVIRRSDLVEVQEPDARGFRIIGGYDAVKRFVANKFAGVLKDTGRADRFGVPLPRGLLLFGPPGTGKTLFAKALSGEINLPFINLRTENLYSKWLGESGQRFAEAIRLAEQMSPAIVFVDEIDRFGKRHEGGDGASQESQRVFSQVLEWLGDSTRRSIIVGTTNAPQALDPALTREGRFDFKIPFLYPGIEARREILRIHLTALGPRGTLPWDLSGDEFCALLRQVAEVTEGMTGAELEQICIRARYNAFESSRETAIADDLLKAARGFRLSPTKRESDRAEYLAMAAEYTNDESFLAELSRDR
jgi:ATP-dependent 26S proteasome regulatory subunit